MDDRDQVLREIADGENWLAQSLPPGDILSTEHLRLRVRVELSEQWLRTHWKPVDLDPSTASLQKTVRGAIVESAPAEGVHSGHALKTWRRILPAALGLAALLALSVSVFNSGNANESDFDSNLTAFEESTIPDGFDDKFEDVLADLDDLLASTAESEWEDILDGL